MIQKLLRIKSQLFISASCKCNGKTNAAGSGGKDCKSILESTGNKWCYVNTGDCSDAKGAASNPWSEAPCVSTPTSGE